MNPKLILSWFVDLDNIVLQVRIVDLLSKECPADQAYGVPRAKVIELDENLRLALIVNAFVILLKKALEDAQTEEHITHTVNASALLLAVLDTKVRTARFEWSEA